MFGSDNSIEPVRAVAALMVRPDGSGAMRIFPEPPGREEKPDGLLAHARRALGKDTAEPTPASAAAEGKGSLFRRRPTEPEKPDPVAKQHGLYTTEKRGTRRYYSDYQQKEEVMRADPKRISTKLDDKQTVSAMLDLAQSRGWDTVRLKGSKDFQREAWVQSQVRGIAAEGYKPSATDQQEAARRTAAVAPVQAAPAKAAESTASAGAGASRYIPKVTNSVTVVASARTGETVPIKAAAPAQAASTKDAPASRQAEQTKAAAGAVASRYTLKVTDGAAAAAPTQKAEAAPVKAGEAGPPKRAAATKRAAAAPAQAASTKDAPAAVQASTASAAPAQVASTKAAPATVQAPTAAANDGAAADKAKATPAQRKGVWDAVEATGKQARAADAATAKVSTKATAGERSTSASTA